MRRRGGKMSAALPHVGSEPIWRKYATPKMAGINFKCTNPSFGAIWPSEFDQINCCAAIQLYSSNFIFKFAVFRYT
jgi:hypothetical protein